MNESLSEKIELALSKLTEFLEHSSQSIKKEKEEFAAFLLAENERLKNGFDELEVEAERLEAEATRIEAERIEAERIEYEENEAARIEAERTNDEMKLPKAEQKEKRIRV